MSESAPPSRPTFRDAVRVWVLVGLNSFGGPAGQIAVMHRLLVEDRKWISEKRFLHALNYCMLLPGPEAQQLATYLGWLLHGTVGGLVAGGLFILPGVVAVLALSIVYALYQDVTFVEGLFFGIKPAVLAIVLGAVVRIAGRALKEKWLYGLAAAAFAAIFLFNVPFPVIVIGAALAGYAGARFGLSKAPPDGTDEDDDDGVVGPLVSPSWHRALRILVIWGIIWWAPVGLLAWQLGPSHVFVQEGVFFSKTAVVTFGGAYAVLAYLAQQAVERYGWLAPGEMLDGLGMAETTPGPLIMVVQFVGFMGAFRNPGALDPLMAGILGAAITSWVTFAPCFLWIFLGAPYIEALRHNRALSAALTGITAAVVGVIVNLAVWFAVHTLFGEVRELSAYGIHWLAPVWTTFDPAAGLLALAAAIAVLRFRVGMLPVIACAALAGVLWRMVQTSG